MPSPKHILVIRLSAMGDVAMTVPVLSAFCAQHPAIKVTVLTRGFFKPFFKHLPNVSVFEADLKGRHKGLVGLWRLSRELKTLKVDAVADLHNVLRSKVLKFFFAGTAFAQLDKGRAEKKALVTGKIFKQLKSTHRRYADVFQALGFSINLDDITFPEKSQLEKSHIDLIGNDAKRWIGIAPFAAYQGKTYPLSLMEQVIEKLSDDFKVLLFGAGNEEAQQLEAVSKKYPNAVNLAGKFSLEDELSIISNLDLMISMDSGNAHLAAMRGVKVLTLWGVTHPYAGFMPFNQPITSAVLANKATYPEIPTSVYGNKLPQGYENIMESITPQQIVSKAHQILA